MFSTLGLEGVECPVHKRDMHTQAFRKNEMVIFMLHYDSASTKSLREENFIFDISWNFRQILLHQLLRDT